MNNLPVSLLLLQAQQLLNDADEANHSGDFGTFALQAQARQVLAEAIDRLAAAREAVNTDLELVALHAHELLEVAHG